MSETSAPTAAAYRTQAQGREKFLGHLAMLVFALLIAGSFSFGKLATPFIDPVPLNAARFVGAALLMGLIAFGVLRLPVRWPRSSWRFGVLGGLMAVYFVSMFVALGITSPISTSAVFTLMPILTAIAAYFLLSQVISPLTGLSLALAGAGAIWVIFGGSASAIARFEVGRGELIYLGGCVAHAIYAPLLRRFNRAEPLAYSTFFVLASVAIWIVIAGWPQIAATDWAHLPPTVWWVLLYLGVFPSGATFFLIQYAALRLPAAKVLAYGYLAPVFVICIEGLSGRGWPSGSVLLGALVTVGGLIVLYFARDD